MGKRKCQECGTNEDVNRIDIYNSPWNDKPSDKKYWCEQCEDMYRDTYVSCNGCGKYVLRTDSRTNDEEEDICDKCFQEEYLEKGIEMFSDFKDADIIRGAWIKDTYIKEAGYISIDKAEVRYSIRLFHDITWNYFYINTQHIQEFLDAIYELTVLGYKVVVKYGSISLFGDGDCSVWVKKKENDSDGSHDNAEQQHRE